MPLRINDVAPDFTAETTHGTINFHRWIGDGWAILFSHPKDFTPVCTTELGAVAGMQDDFAARNCKVIGVSVDGVSDHEAWSNDIESSQGHAVTYPLVGDPKLEVVKAYDMLPADTGDTSEGRTPMDNATARSVFVIGPDKKIKATLTYPEISTIGASARLPRSVRQKPRPPLSFPWLIAILSGWTAVILQRLLMPLYDELGSPCKGSRRIPGGRGLSGDGGIAEECGRVLG